MNKVYPFPLCHGFCWGGGHGAVDRYATQQVFVCQVVAGVILAVYLHGRDVAVRGIIVVGIDHYLLAVFQIQRHAFE